MKLKKIYQLLLGCGLLFNFLSCKTEDVEFSDSPIVPDELVAIPDVAFAEYLKFLAIPGIITDNQNGQKVYFLDPEEVKKVKYLNLSKTSNSIKNLSDAGLSTAEIKIANLSGIEYFTGLTRLVITSNSITQLHTQTLTELDSLEMNFNLVGELDLSHNTKLTYLRYEASGSATEDHKIKTIDLSKNSALQHLYLPKHLIETIDLTQNTAMKDLINLTGNPGPDKDPQTADISIPDNIFTQIEAKNRLGVKSDKANIPETLFIINEVLYDPSNTALEGDANGDGKYSQEEDEFIELYNPNDQSVNISGFKVYDAESLQSGTPVHTFAAGTIIPAGKALVLFGGGTPVGTFGGAVVVVSNSGNMNLNNNEDVITITDASGKVIVTFDIGPLSNNPNESYTRNPDITGEFVQHKTLGSRLFSPGTKNNGSSF